MNLQVEDAAVNMLISEEISLHLHFPPTVFERAGFSTQANSTNPFNEVNSLVN